MIARQSTAFAPATVANLGPGFDVLGLALEDVGDVVRIDVDPGGKPGVIIASITGDGGRLPKDPYLNTAGYAVVQLLQERGLEGLLSVKLDLRKGLPLGSGMGSSAASAVAAIVAFEGIFEEQLPQEVLLRIACECERAACGTPHADNVAPSLLGGLVLWSPLMNKPVSIPVPEDLWCAVVHPEMEIRTEDARRVLPEHISMTSAIETAGQLGSLISGMYESDYERISAALVDPLVTPFRAKLIPGFEKMMQSISKVGAIGGGISGSGPSVFALGSYEESVRKAALTIQRCFLEENVQSDQLISKVSAKGARLIENI